MKEVKLIIAMLMISVATSAQTNVYVVTDTTDLSILNQVHELEEISVVSDGPKTKMKGNSMETRIAGSNLEHAGTAEDVLSKIPGITRQGNEISVIGRGTPEFFINGRRIIDPNELRQIMSEQIKSVEVISNPGVEYGTNVNAVVKIKTIRPSGEGMGFDIKSDLSYNTQETDISPNTHINLNYHKNSIDIFTGADISDKYDYLKSDIGGVTYSKNQSHEQKGSVSNTTHQRGYQCKGGINYQISEKHSAGAMFQFQKTPYHNSETIMDEDIIKNGTLTNHLTSKDISKNNDYHGISANAYYNGHIGKMSVEYNIDAISRTTNYSDNISEHNQLKLNTISSQTNRKNKFLASKLILRYPLKNSELTLGTEEVFVESNTSYTSDAEILSDCWSVANESTVALFAQLSKKLSICEINLGTRYELVAMLFEDCYNTQFNERKTKHNLFPYISAGTKIGNWGLLANYTVKTTRPTYWQLRDAMEYHSQYVIEGGNPKLQNTINQELSLKAKYKWLILGAEYLYAQNKIVKWGTPFNDEGTILLRAENLHKPVNNLTLYAVGEHQISCWTPNYTFGIQKQFLKLPLEDTRIDGGIRNGKFGKPMILFNAVNTFAIGKKNPLILECNFKYRSTMHHDNNELRKPINSLDIAVQKSFMKGNITIRISGTDLLNQTTEDVFADYGNYLVFQTRKLQHQSLTLSLHYRLNSHPSKYKGTGAGEDAKARI